MYSPQRTFRLTQLTQPVERGTEGAEELDQLANIVVTDRFGRQREGVVDLDR